jgi:succinoglycan biosynthesis transport protein ExoP
MSENHTEPSGENRGGGAQLVPVTPNALTPLAYGAGAPPGYEAGSPPPEEGGFDLLQYLRLLRKRKWLVLGMAAAFSVYGATKALLVTPLYTASARIQIDRSVAKIVEGGNISPAETGDSEFLRTQYELLQGRSISERVASALKLGEDPDFFKPRQISITDALKNLIRTPPPPPTGDKKALKEAAADIVMAGRAVRPVSGSRLVDIYYTDPSPERAQRIATAYAEAIVSANLDKRLRANAYAKSFLENQLKQFKGRLERSEQALLDFARNEQIPVSNDRVSIAESNLANANNALSAVIAERIRNEQSWKQVKSAKDMSFPQLLSNPVIDGLRNRRNALVGEYQEKLETFKPGYPAMIQINNRIAEIDRQLTAEVKTIKATLKAAYEGSLSQEEELKKRVETLRAEVLDLQKRSVQYNILKREVDSTRSLYEGLLQRYKEVDLAAGVAANNVFIVDRAGPPGAPVTARLMRSILVSLALGAAAGFGLAMLIERFDDRVSSIEGLEQISGLTTLAVIPKIQKKQTVEGELANPRSPLSEAYRSLCTSLQFSTEKGLPKTLFFTSSAPSEGKSFTSMTVARNFAALGLKVLLIDADLRKPSLHAKLNLPNDKGLSDYLNSAVQAEEAFQETGTPNLIFMASGPLPPNPADLLGGARLRSLIPLISEIFDVVVIDGPPVMGLSDAQHLSSATAATIFLTSAGQTRRDQIRGALRRLRMARAPIIGAVLTKFDVNVAGYARAYEYGYGYGYTYGDPLPLETPPAAPARLAGAISTQNT